MRTVDTQPDPSNFYWMALVIFIILGGMLTMTEQAVLSARRTKLDKLAETGGKQAQWALWTIERQDTVLLALRVSFIAVCLAAGFAVIYETRQWALYSLDPLWSPVVLSAAVLTGFSLTIALAVKGADVAQPENLLLRFAWLAKLVTLLLLPLIKLSAGVADTAFRWLNPRKSETADEEDEIEEEVYLLLEQGAQDGLFEKAEQDMVERIFTLDDIRASALMTPRTHITWLDLEDTPENHLEIVRQTGHSRYPVARGSLDDVAGVVFVKDMLGMMAGGQAIWIEEHIRTPVFVPKSMSGLRILELFKKAGTHIALVIDEYGGVLGLITINDILEHIVGDLPLADEPETAMLVQREDGSWLADGMLPIEDLKELIMVEELPEEDRENYQTAGGFVTSYLERIPAVSEFFIWNGWRFEVLDMDRSRIDKILISQIQPAQWESLSD